MTLLLEDWHVSFGSAYSYDVLVLLTQLSRETIINGIILRLQMESRHSGNQTRNGQTGKNTGLESRGILTSMSLRFGWRVHLASDVLFHCFPIVPVRPRSISFFLTFLVPIFSFWFRLFSHYLFIFQFFQITQGICAFPRMEALRTEPKSHPHAMEKKWDKIKLRMLVQGGPSFNLSPLMPWPLHCLFVFF